MATTTEAMRKASPVQQVMDTPELLEMILSSLSPLEVLLSQRVSRMWDGVIKQSPRIQRLLFLRPDWNLEYKTFNAWRPVNLPGERPKNNRMLRHVLDGRYPTVTLKVTNQDEDAEDSGVDVTDDNNFGIDVPRKSKTDMGHWSWDVNINCSSERLPNDNPAVWYEGASWRKMYICQPPCTSLYLVRRWQRSARPVIHCDTGITMEIFVDAASKGKDIWKSSDGDYHFEGAIKCSSIQESEQRFGTREVVYDHYVLERLMGIGYLASKGSLD